MKHSKVYRLWSGSGAILLILIILDAFIPANWITWSLYAVLAFFAVVSIILPKQLRCPYCKRPIHPRNIHLEFCPNCGNRIN